MSFSKEEKDLLVNSGFKVQSYKELPEFAYKAQSNGQFVISLSKSGWVSASFDNTQTEDCNLGIFKTVQESLDYFKSL